MRLPVYHAGKLSAAFAYQTGYEIVKKKQNRPRKHIYVREILKSYRNDYEKQFDNLCRILLRHLLGKMLVTGSASQEEEPYEVLEELVCSQTAEELKKQCREIIDSTTDCMER